MKSLLYNISKKSGIELSENELEKFQKYYELMIETNKVMNLTSSTEKNEAANKHFLDSIILKKYISLSGNIIDVGTGAGFPGIPLSIILPDADFTLMDSLNKRIKFLDEVIEECNIKNVQTVHSRAEDLSKNINYREKYDYCVSRAVANMSVLLELCIPFVKIGGKFISYKSGTAEEEIEESESAQKILGCRLLDIIEFELSGTDIKRKFVIFEKVKGTPKKYPRQAGKPKKEPL